MLCSTMCSCNATVGDAFLSNGGPQMSLQLWEKPTPKGIVILNKCKFIYISLHKIKNDSDLSYLDGSVLCAVWADLSDAVLKPVQLWFVPRVRPVWAKTNTQMLHQEGQDSHSMCNSNMLHSHPATHTHQLPTHSWLNRINPVFQQENININWCTLGYALLMWQIIDY